MANIRIILDKRRARNDNSFPIVFSLHHRETIRISTGLYAAPDEWNEAAGSFKGKTMTQKAHNARLRHLSGIAETLLMNMEVSGELRKLTAAALKSRLKTELGMAPGSSALLVDYLEKAKLGKAPRTQRLFSWAQDQVRRIDPRVGVADIDEAWILRYRDDLLERYSPNTAAQGMAWVSRALSLAVADGTIPKNPASGVRKPHAETRKKALTLEALRTLRDMEFTGKGAESKTMARDMFFLQFYLLGINVADLYDVKEVVDGRIDYARRKTGTLYSVKVQPEAMRIIEKYRGTRTLVRLADRFLSASSACSVLTHWLKRMLPGVSTNYARHTWATMAAEIGIPIETVSHALGHKIGSPVTAIYVAFNQKKVDEANRRVIDYVNAKALTLEALRTLRDMEFTGEGAESKTMARDMFFLQFYLLGINVADLYDVKEVVDGRIDYARRKTGTLYSVKVQPEAMRIIEKYRGTRTLVCLADRYPSASSACSVLTHWLKRMLPGVSTNCARHTWATMAAEIGIPIETVSHALGHKIGSPVTAIQKKVDETNRRVIDYVNADLYEWTE